MEKSKFNFHKHDEISLLLCVHCTPYTIQPYILCIAAYELLSFHMVAIAIVIGTVVTAANRSWIMTTYLMMNYFKMCLCRNHIGSISKNAIELSDCSKSIVFKLQAHSDNGIKSITNFLDEYLLFMLV